MESGFLFIILHLWIGHGILNSNIGKGVCYHHEFSWKYICLLFDIIKSQGLFGITDGVGLTNGLRSSQCFVRNGNKAHNGRNFLVVKANSHWIEDRFEFLMYKCRNISACDKKNNRKVVF